MNVTYNPLNDTVVFTVSSFDDYEAINDFMNDYIHDQNQINRIKLNSISRSRPVSEITKIISNDDATIVFFSDKTKIVVKRMPGDDDDIYAAVAQAVCKKLYGSTGNFHKIVNQKLEDFRSPVCIASPVFNSFGRFFNDLWEITHPTHNKEEE